jgi:hypothetical protein
MNLTITCIVHKAIKKTAIPPNLYFTSKSYQNQSFNLINPKLYKAITHNITLKQKKIKLLSKSSQNKPITFWLSD